MKEDNELVQTILIQFSFPYQEMATEKEGENKSIPLPQGIANLAEHTVRQMILWKRQEIWSCDINIYKDENGHVQYYKKQSICNKKNYL